MASSATAVATRSTGGCLVAVASEHATKRYGPRGLQVIRLVHRPLSPREAPPLLGPDESTEMAIEAVRTLVLPVPILNLVFCGYHRLCVVHAHEYVLISIASGGVTELFRFEAAYGSRTDSRRQRALLR